MHITLIENFRAVFYAPFYAAMALKAYADEGLDVELKMSGDAARTAASLIAGHGDVSWGGPLRLMMALEKSPDGAAIAFCEAIGRDPFYLLAREPNPAFRLQDLAGKRLSVTTEVPTPWMCLRHDLGLAGVDLKEIKVIAGRTMAESVAALRSGEADVIQVFQPFGAALVHEGTAHAWYAAASRGLVSYTTLNTTRAFAEKNPDALLKMCRAMYRTLTWIAAHEGRELAALLASWLPDVPRPILTACFDGYKSLGLWNRTPILERAGFDWLRDAALATGILKKKITYEDCVDMRYAEAAVRESPPPLSS
jgi:NitT/TauT family transport system substrate-binding protein